MGAASRRLNYISGRAGDMDAHSRQHLPRDCTFKQMGIDMGKIGFVLVTVGDSLLGQSALHGWLGAVTPLTTGAAK